MDEALIEQAVTAHRGADVLTGRIQGAPAWYDLTPEERDEAYARTVTQRTLEAALDPDGLSSTARAVLARIHR